jgi:hypothetical protein
VHVDFWRAVLGYLAFVIITSAISHLGLYE